MLRSRAVIVVDIGTEGLTERSFIKHDHMIETLAPQGTNHPQHRLSAKGSAVWTELRGCPCPVPLSEIMGEDGIAVAEQVARELAEGESPHLLPCPFGGRGGGHIEMK